MLKKAAAFLNDGVQVELTKPNLTNWIIARIENFLPETCKMCDKQYCITFGQKPALACFICGQGIHEACYLKKINNHIIPDILGLHWLCSYCSPRATITNEPRTLPQTGRSKQTLIGEIDMANKSCHTQAIQVPLVNDKNEDNDMQTPTKQETGDPAEKDQTSHEKKQIQSKRSNEGRPVCIHYRRNKCKHGLSGTGCMYSHPKPCRPYINFGTDRKKGCQNGRECELLHPKMCRNSLRKKECFGENCKFMHRKGTIRIKTTEPTPPGPSSAGYENHFPKMRKPGHGSARHNLPTTTTAVLHTDDSAKPGNIDTKADTWTYRARTTNTDSPADRISSQHSPSNYNSLANNRADVSGTTSIITANIQGLYPKTKQCKVPFLEELATENNSKIIGITESHLNENIRNSEITINRFNIFRCDRQGRSHGGVIMYIHDTYACIELVNESNAYCNLLCIKIIQLNTVVTIMYRPPNSPTLSFTEPLTKLQQILGNMASPMPDIILLGDFNFPNIIWPHGHILKLGTKAEQIQAAKLLEVTEKLYLKQMMTEATRNNNTIDLVFTNNEDTLFDLHSTPTILSDHNIIEMHLHIGNEPNATTLKQKDMPKLCRYDYHQAIWETINNQLQIIDWDLYLTGPDKHKKFLNKIEEICEKNVPLKKTKSTKKPVPRERKILMRKRSRLRNKTSKLTSKHELQKVLDQIYRLEDNLKQHYDEERNNAEKKAIENIKKNPKCFYSFAKKYSNTKSTIGPL
ncbi:fission process 1 [Octopus vulgaris]|uniref:Fission process 1 n=1 Tax=Octopus vulgaris TaxID=6645 RepID=A0AA36BBT1_OCTVU|nr:fission process 1 [Octopus vulgaris]